MRTDIFITGQTMSADILYRHIRTLESEERRFFNDYILTFPSKKEALKALKSAYKSLKEDGATYNKHQETLHYDAGYASISK